MNKRIVLAVFLGLLASAAALVASLFMLQELKQTTGLKAKVDSTYTALQNLNGQIDLTGVNKQIEELYKEVNDLGSTVTELSNNADKPVTTVPTQTSTTTNTTKPSVVNPVKPIDSGKTNTTPSPVVQPNKDKASTTARVNVRANPGLKSKIIRTATTQEKLTVLGNELVRDGYTWVQVQDSKGKIGWVAKRYTN